MRDALKRINLINKEYLLGLLATNHFKKVQLKKKLKKLLINPNQKISYNLDKTSSNLPVTTPNKHSNKEIFTNTVKNVNLVKKLIK